MTLKLWNPKLWEGENGNGAKKIQRAFVLEESADQKATKEASSSKGYTFLKF